MADNPGGSKDLQASISDAIKQGTKRTSIEEIQKRGFSHVKVLDNKKIGELIYNAVEAVLAERGRNLLDEERDRLASSARAEFQKLMADQQKAMKRAEQVEQAKAKLEAEMQKMSELVTSAAGIPGEDGAGGRATLDQQIRKMTDRQKLLIDKYTDADEKRREAEGHMIQAKLKIEELHVEMAKMKAKGVASPSQFIEEIRALKDLRDDLKRRGSVIDVFVHNLAIAEYALSNGLQLPENPKPGKSVGVLMGDRKTPLTGIKVRYEPGNPEPIIDFPEGKGPAPYTPPGGKSANGNGAQN
ncbi:MAG: hypothetical protein AB7K09_12220 [Planctomycetota bacterium]